MTKQRRLPIAAPPRDVDYVYDVNNDKVRVGDDVLLVQDEDRMAFGVHVVKRTYIRSGLEKVELEFGRRNLYVLARNVKRMSVGD